MSPSGVHLAINTLCGPVQGRGHVGSLDQTHSGYLNETCWRAVSRDPSFRRNGSVGSGVKSLSSFHPRCSLFIYRGNLCWCMTTSSYAVGGNYRLFWKLFNGNQVYPPVWGNDRSIINVNTICDSFVRTFNTTMIIVVNNFY